MTLICYDRSLRFQKSARETIDWANAVIAEYKAKGFSLTLRQLYYQAVSRHHVPENTLQQYKRLGDIISRARIAGLIDWESIIDMTRFVRDEHPQEDRNYMPFLKGSAESWTIDWWQDQIYRPMVLIEKDALAGVVDGICREYQVPYLPCRGYTSQSEQWRLGQRIRLQKEMGLIPIMFHLGDHDPSGIDMTRDNEARLWMFGGHVELRRLALNWDQVQKYNPPPNPAKMTDSRVDNYIKNFGDECWELDALDPQVIADLVEEAILSILDKEKFETRKAENDIQRQEIVDMVDLIGKPPEHDVYEWVDPWK